MRPQWIRQPDGRPVLKITESHSITELNSGATIQHAENDLWYIESRKVHQDFSVTTTQHEFTTDELRAAFGYTPEELRKELWYVPKFLNHDRTLEEHWDEQYELILRGKFARKGHLLRIPGPIGTQTEDTRWQSRAAFILLNARIYKSVKQFIRLTER